MKTLLLKLWDAFGHFIGRLTGKYYWEDYIRVYPDGLCINRRGLKRAPTQNDINNYLNHRKFYNFVSQFVKEKTVADIGCGSGYGSDIMRQAGAKAVFGADVSKHAVRFAKNRYRDIHFSLQSITDLKHYADNQFDVIICSEVLEHIKEYNKEQDAIKELARVTKKSGLIILGTPNSELLGDHGFTFQEMDALMQSHFNQFVIFENALVPAGQFRDNWQQRLDKGQTGIIVSEKINLAETVKLEDESLEVKAGIEPGMFQLGDLEINTTLLHNTHSWVVIAINNK